MLVVGEGNHVDQGEWQLSHSLFCYTLFELTGYVLVLIKVFILDRPEFNPQTMYFILFYKTVSNYVERRAPFRDEHLRLAREARAKGDIVMAGALADPADGAVLVFKGESAKVAEDFAKNDPYVKNGLITEWYVRSWTVVVGNE